MIRIKICCMQSAAEIRLAVSHGVTALGFVSAMPSGPGPVPESVIRELVPRVPRGVRAFLLTSLGDANAIAAQVRRTAVDTVQIVDRLVSGTYADLRAGQSVYGLWKARLDTLGQRVRVRYGEAGGEVQEGLAEDVDESGSLILRRPDGSTARVEAGDVTLKA